MKPSAKNMRRAVNTFHPEIEALEDRCLPSVVNILQGAALDGRNIAEVIGTSSADTIFIDDNGSDVSVHFRDAAGRSQAVRNNISEVRVRAGGGDDTVTYWLHGSLGSLRSINVDLGEGDDTFVANLTYYWRSGRWVSHNLIGSDLLDGANLNLTVRGGRGDDTIQVFANEGVRVDPRAILSFNLAGEGDNDDIGVFYNGQLDGRLEFIADGGSGTDTVFANVVLNAGSEGVLGNEARPAQVRGGGGQDELTFLLWDHSDGQADVFARMVFSDWGPFDEATFTNNVDVIW